eukprot:TRINITY_DN31896_c0_g1_i1.p1 TRINITY_DN31896_c0_g1~~TRINITY_DN31896_c0_g1_i1.p1  ORF type:complete len:251 (+),score=38.93 TRINITY_DN31896_c0_g1_i1:108-755(+)
MDKNETSAVVQQQFLPKRCDEVVELPPQKPPGTRLEREDTLRPHTFDVCLGKGGRLGLAMDVKETGLTVVRVNDGSLLSAYNDRAAPLNRVKPHDFIVDVNGERGIEDMMAEVKFGHSINLRIVRPLTYEVKVSKGSLGLGVSFDYKPESTSIDVKTIAAGAIQDYNANVASGLQVVPGDFIISVNDVSDSAEKMIDTIRSNTELTLIFARPPLK